MLGEIWRDAPRRTMVKVTDDVITCRWNGLTARFRSSRSRFRAAILRGVRGGCGTGGGGGPRCRIPRRTWWWACRVAGGALDSIETAMLLTRVVAAVATAAGAAAITGLPAD